MIYESICTKCGKEHTYITTVARRNRTPVCCGYSTIREIRTAPQVGAMTWSGWKGFTHPTANGMQHFETGDQFKRYMKENNLVSDHEGTTEAENARKRRKQKEEKSLHETVSRVVHTAIPD